MTEFECQACHRTIGKNAGHNVTDHGRVMCSRCLNHRDLHSDWWPDCPHSWHDNFDHIRRIGSTRAAIAHQLRNVP